MSSAAAVDRLPAPVLDAITVRRRRLVLAVLEDRRSPVSERELATQIAAIEGEKPLVEVTREEVESIRVDLVHAQLPRLEGTSLIERDADGVTTADHPALEDPIFRQLVEAEVDRPDDGGSAVGGWDGDDWTTVVSMLASRRRRAVIAVLESRDGPMAQDDLAVAVHRQETGVEPSDDVPADVLASLHHVHLPKLDAAGLVAYDAEAGTVTYEGHPMLERVWSDSAPDETPCPA